MPEGASLPPGALLLAEAPAGDGFVFGDGSHPTTRLCAGAVDQLCRARCPRAVLDVGTGTGILARIARARGATFVAGTDIDAGALEVARAAARLDDAAAGIHFGAEPPDHWGARFDLVVANILEGPLTHLAPSIVAALREGGVLLLSGFTAAQAPRLRRVYESLGMRPAREAGLGGWVLLMMERGGAVGASVTPTGPSGRPPAASGPRGPS